MAKMPNAVVNVTRKLYSLREANNKVVVVSEWASEWLNERSIVRASERSGE